MSLDIDAMIAEVKTSNYPDMTLKKDDSKCLKSLCNETFEKMETDLENAQLQFAAATEKLKELGEDQQELMEILEAKKLDETLNATLTEECKKVVEALKA